MNEEGGTRRMSATATSEEWSAARRHHHQQHQCRVDATAASTAPVVIRTRTREADSCRHGRSGARRSEQKAPPRRTVKVPPSRRRVVTPPPKEDPIRLLIRCCPSLRLEPQQRLLRLTGLLDPLHHEGLTPHVQRANTPPPIPAQTHHPPDPPTHSPKTVTPPSTPEKPRDAMATESFAQTAPRLLFDASGHHPSKRPTARHDKEANRSPSFRKPPFSRTINSLSNFMTDSYLVDSVVTAPQQHPRRCDQSQWNTASVSGNQQLPMLKSSRPHATSARRICNSKQNDDTVVGEVKDEMGNHTFDVHLWKGEKDEGNKKEAVETRDDAPKQQTTGRAVEVNAQQDVATKKTLLLEETNGVEEAMKQQIHAEEGNTFEGEKNNTDPINKESKQLDTYLGHDGIQEVYDKVAKDDWKGTLNEKHLDEEEDTATSIETTNEVDCAEEGERCPNDNVAKDDDGDAIALEPWIRETKTVNFIQGEVNSLLLTSATEDRVDKEPLGLPLSSGSNKYEAVSSHAGTKDTVIVEVTDARVGFSNSKHPTSGNDDILPVSPDSSSTIKGGTIENTNSANDGMQNNNGSPSDEFEFDSQNHHHHDTCNDLEIAQINDCTNGCYDDDDDCIDLPPPPSPTTSHTPPPPPIIQSEILSIQTPLHHPTVIRDPFGTFLMQHGSSHYYDSCAADNNNNTCNDGTDHFSFPSGEMFPWSEANMRTIDDAGVAHVSRVNGNVMGLRQRSMPMFNGHDPDSNSGIPIGRSSSAGTAANVARRGNGGMGYLQFSPSMREATGMHNDPSFVPLNDRSMGVGTHPSEPTKTHTPLFTAMPPKWKADGGQQPPGSGTAENDEPPLNENQMYRQEKKNGVVESSLLPRSSHEENKNTSRSARSLAFVQFAPSMRQTSAGRLLAPDDDSDDGDDDDDAKSIPKSEVVYGEGGRNNSRGREPYRKPPQKSQGSVCTNSRRDAANPRAASSLDVVRQVAAHDQEESGDFSEGDSSSRDSNRTFGIALMSSLQNPRRRHKSLAPPIRRKRDAHRRNSDSSRLDIVVQGEGANSVGIFARLRKKFGGTKKKYGPKNRGKSSNKHKK